MKKALFAFLTSVLFFGLAYTQSAQALIAEGKKFKDMNKEEQALPFFVKAAEVEPNNYEALWNASLLMSRIGNRQTEVGMKTNYFRNAKDYAQKAVKVNPNDAEGYYVLSVAFGRIALIAGSKEKVAASTDIKENATKATQLNPNHAGAWHVLGLWNYKVMDLNFVERGFANLLFGGLPEGASNENAVECFNKAIKLNPSNVLYYKDLARAYVALNKTDDARRTCEKCLSLPSVGLDDAGYKKDCQEIKDDL